MPTGPGYTDGTNASVNIASFIASKPDGSSPTNHTRIVFPAGATYTFSGDGSDESHGGIVLKNRNNLTLDGTGATLLLNTGSVSTFSSAFFVQNSTHLSFRGFAVDGGNTATGTTGAAAAVDERINAAVMYTGSKFIEFDRVSWDRLKGFGPIISSNEGTVWPEDIYIHDCTIRGGEMGIGLVAGRRVQVVQSAINDSVDTAFDLEPDPSSAGPNGEPGLGGGFQNVLISDNDITRYGWGQVLTSWFVAAVPQASVMDTAVMEGLWITGNRVHIGAATADNGNADGLGGLGIRSNGTNTKRDVIINNNWTLDDDTRPPTRFVINLLNVVNLTVTFNRQPIINGSGFVGDTNTTGTRVVHDNDTSP